MDPFFQRAYKMHTVGAFFHANDNMEYANQKPIYLYTCGMHEVTEDEYITDRPDGWDNYQLIYCVEGCGHFYINGNEMLLNSGEILIYRPGEPQYYRYNAGDKTKVYYLHFGGYMIEDLLESCGLADARCYSLGLTDEVEELILKILNIMILKDENCETEANGYLMVLLSAISKHCRLRKNPNANVSNYKIIIPAVDYLRKNFEKDTTVTELAAMCNLSTSRFAHLFTSIMGVSPLKYTHQLRINHAKLLLKLTDKTIAEIAYAVGYNDSLYFSRYFKKTVGFSPNEYRS